MGTGAGSAGPPRRWGASSLQGVGGAESRAHGGAGRAREPPCTRPARAPGFVPSWAGRTGGGRHGGVCASAEDSGSLGSLLGANSQTRATLAASNLPQFPSSRTQKLRRPLRTLLDSWKSASQGKTIFFFPGNSGGSSTVRWMPSWGRIPSLPFLLLFSFTL